MTRLPAIGEADRQRILHRFESKAGVGESANNAPIKRMLVAPDDLFAKLSRNQQAAGRRALMQLVRLTETDPPNPSTRLAVSVREFALSEQRVLPDLVSAHLITSDRKPTTGEEQVQLANDALLEWPTLRKWVQEDGRFLLWRQKLRIRMAQWQHTRDTDRMLQGVHLQEALEWRSLEESRLSLSELDFILRSANGGVLPVLRYKAFLSYGYSDKLLARALADEVNRLASSIFRERTKLFDSSPRVGAISDLPPGVRRALGDSEYLVPLASPEAASSQQVSSEVETWLNKRPPENLLIVLTGGEIVWSSFDDDFDWSTTTAVPAVLTKIFREAPLYAGLRWVKREKGLLSTDPRFGQEVARLTASLYGQPMGDVIRVDTLRTRRRRFWRLTVAAIAFTLLLMVLAFSTFRVRRELEATKSEVNRWRTLAEERQKKIDELFQELDRHGAKSK